MRYVVAVRNTRFLGAVVCPVCRAGWDDVRLDPLPRFRPRRKGETCPGAIVWTRGGAPCDELLFDKTVVNTGRMPNVRFQVVCPECRKVASLPPFMPVDVCRCGRLNLNCVAVLRWEKIAKGKYRPVTAAAAQPHLNPTASTKQSSTIALDPHQRISYVSKYTRVAARVVPLGRDGWFWINPVVSDGVCEVCALLDDAVVHERYGVVPVWHGGSSATFFGASGGGSAVDGEKLESSDEEEPEVFNICFVCQNIGDWPVFDVCPSAFVMREFTTLGIARNLPLCPRCVVPCHRCGERPALVDHSGRLPSAICDECNQLCSK